MYVTIDPGLQTGWALWSKVVGLVACGLGDPRQSEKHLVTSARSAVDLVHDAWIEWPVIYPRSKARPADIMKVARCAGEYGGMYRTVGVDVHYVEPAEWKGQLDKEKHHPIIWAALGAGEQALVHEACRGLAPSKRHNVLDAVGLGLFVCRRIRRP